MFRRLSEFFLDILEVVVFAVAIFLFVYLLIMQPHKIKGQSMDPNFPDGEYLLTDKVSYRFGEPERGDVVVFEAPTGQGEEFIKRIIGLPGDTVTVKTGQVYVNGILLNESYLAPSLVTNSGNFLTEGKSISVPDNSFIVFGDNRPHSSDSRAWGFIKKEDITGRAWVVYWPFSNAGLVEKVIY